MVLLTLSNCIINRGIIVFIVQLKRFVLSVRQLVVEHEEVRLYMDCGEAERTTFHRSPERLTFSHDSGIFVSNAGSTGLDKFVVSVQVHYISCYHPDGHSSRGAAGLLGFFSCYKAGFFYENSD